MFNGRRGLTGRSIAAISLMVLWGTLGPTQVWGQAAETDHKDAVATIEAYHQALANQDSLAARALLSQDAVVLESGYAETLEEYLSHHLGADMEFSAQVQSKREVMQARVAGDVAWVSSTSTVEGVFREREIRAAGVELMVLTRTDGKWKIAAIHWSSRSLD